MLAESHGDSYRPLRSLEEAKQHLDAAVVIEGDDGGQIHATAPVSVVRCSQARLERLARELEGIAGSANDIGSSARVFFERLPIGSGVGGGMGGGAIVAGVWVHDEHRQLGLAPAIADVIEGRAEELPLPDPDVTVDFVDRVKAAYQVRPSPSGGCSAFLRRRAARLRVTIGPRRLERPTDTTAIPDGTQALRARSRAARALWCVHRPTTNNEMTETATEHQEAP